MKLSFPRTIALLSVLFFLSSCAAPGNGPDNRTDDSKRTEAEGTAFGAVLGGLVGAGLGAAVDSGNRGRGAIIGGVVGAAGGAVAGNIYGKNAAQRKQMYANEEDRLNGEIDVVRGYNADLEKRNDECYQEIQELKRRTQNLHAKSEEAKRKAYLTSKEKSSLDASIQTNEKDLAAYREELQSLTQYKAELEKKGEQNRPQVAELEKEISLLRKHINTLDSNNKQMARLAENLSVSK